MTYVAIWPTEFMSALSHSYQSHLSTFSCYLCSQPLSMPVTNKDTFLAPCYYSLYSKNSEFWRQNSAPIPFYKFADDATVLGSALNNEEAEYRKETALQQIWHPFVYFSPPTFDTTLICQSRPSSPVSTYHLPDYVPPQPCFSIFLPLITISLKGSDLQCPFPQDAVWRTQSLQ